MEKIIINNNMFSCLWAVGWLFTIGYLKLPLKKGIFAIILWPYYMGLKWSKEPGEHKAHHEPVEGKTE